MRDFGTNFMAADQSRDGQDQHEGKSCCSYKSLNGAPVQHVHAQHAHGDNAHGGTPAHLAKDMAKDPVCGMSVDPDTAKHRAEHAGKAYYFCCAGCRTKFLADPQKYLKSEDAKAEHVPAGTIYTCPMHPEIRQVGPG